MSDPTRDRLLSHEVDGIREFDNALPRWWLYGFYFTIAFAVVYFANYHLLPRPLFGARTVVAEYEAEMAVVNANRPKNSAGAGVVLAALTDPESLSKGEAIFMGNRNLCHTCHRKDLGGLIGPDLTNDLWINGCTVSELAQIVKTGFPVKGMLPYGSGQALTDDEVLQVVSFVLSKSGSHPVNPKAVDPARDKECR